MSELWSRHRVPASWPIAGDGRARAHHASEPQAPARLLHAGALWTKRSFVQDN